MQTIMVEKGVGRKNALLQVSRNSLNESTAPFDACGVLAA